MQKKATMTNSAIPSHISSILAAYEISNHCYKRMSQRAIHQEMLACCILYGQAVCKQGLVFYYVLNKNLPASLPTHLAERLNDLVCVCEENDHCVLTCYRSGNGFSYIKKKSDILQPRSAA